MCVCVCRQESRLITRDIQVPRYTAMRIQKGHDQKKVLVLMIRHNYTKKNSLTSHCDLYNNDGPPYKQIDNIYLNDYTIKQKILLTYLTASPPTANDLFPYSRVPSLSILVNPNLICLQLPLGLFSVFYCITTLSKCSS